MTISVSVAQDLSRMYPTPPSLENTKLPSPETMTDVTHDVVEVKVEAYPMPTAEELCKVRQLFGAHTIDHWFVVFSSLLGNVNRIISIACWWKSGSA